MGVAVDVVDHHQRIVRRQLAFPRGVERIGGVMPGVDDADWERRRYGLGTGRIRQAGANQCVPTL